MMKKLMLLGAGAIGYVLGAKAGRERYEQIAEQAQRLRANPTVQKKVEDAKHMAKDAADTAAEKVREHQNGGSASSGGTTGGPTGTSTTGTTTAGAGPAGFGVGDEDR